MQHLKEIEDPNAQLVQQDRVSEAQCRKAKEQPESESAGKSKSLRQSCKPRHGKLPATGQSGAAVISPGTPA
jgi:hypothetical protein